jgi:hypothetical protein
MGFILDSIIDFIQKVDNPIIAVTIKILSSAPKHMEIFHVDKYDKSLSVVINRAEDDFYRKYGNRFGKHPESFLDRQINVDRIKNSISNPFSEQISTADLCDGYNGEPPTLEAKQFFIDRVYIYASQDYDLNMLIEQKKKIIDNEKFKKEIRSRFEETKREEDLPHKQKESHQENSSNHSSTDRDKNGTQSCQDSGKSSIIFVPDENFICKRAQMLDILFTDFSNMHEIGFIISYQINFDNLINCIIKVYQRELYMEHFHNIQTVNEIQRIASYCFWINKYKPFHCTFDHEKIPSEQREKRDKYFIERFFLYLLTNVLRSLHGVNRLPLSDRVIDYLLYTFKHSDISEEALITIFEVIADVSQPQ